MKKPKYEITINMLDTPGEVRKLERDGHNRHTIHEALFKHTRDATNQERKKMFEKFYDRRD